MPATWRNCVQCRHQPRHQRQRHSQLAAALSRPIRDNFATGLRAVFREIEPLLMEDDAFIQAGSSYVDTLLWSAGVCVTEGNAKQKLEVIRDVQDLSDGMGVKPEHGLGDAGEAASRQRQQ
ncbi:hypothetical protein D9M71_739770 [compost metagenome]